jgi:hypothetical protein
MGWSRCIGGFVLYMGLEGFAISEKLSRSIEKRPRHMAGSFLLLAVLPCIWGSNCGWYPCWPKLIPVYDDAAFVTVVAHLAGDHFDGHANFHGLVADVS